jgi:hypothetical protein
MPLLGATGGGSAKGFGALANLGYFIRNSLRFRSSATAYLNRTPASAGNRKTWTWSGWVKTAALGTTRVMFGAGTNTSNSFRLNFGTTVDRVQFFATSGGTTILNRTSDALFRDTSAWYHLVAVFDTTQANAVDRCKAYINGVFVPLTNTSTDLNQNDDGYVNSTDSHAIGFNFGSAYLDGYLAEINFIDGQALTPSSFGKTDTGTGQWVPRKFAGTYGTNGFYLKFADASAATAAAIGKDSSPNGNNWTPNNISVTAGDTYDAMIDSPTLSAAASNYCVLNPTIANTTNLINANLTRNGAVRTNVGSILLTSGKYYFETTIQDANGNGGVGVKQSTAYPLEGFNTAAGATYFANGEYKIEGAAQTSGFSSYTNGDVIGIAVDTTVSPAKIWFAKNNTWQGTGNPTTAGYSLTAGLDYYFAILHGSASSSTTASANFGQRPFAYTPPTGFKSLNAFNLP